MFNKILLVGVGNICRSPTAERMLKQRLPNLTIESAGLGAMVGCSVDACAASVAAENGLSLDGHFARQISLRMCREFDLILVMEKRHIMTLHEIAPEMCGNVMLFGHWDKGCDILDPYRKCRKRYDVAYHLLERSADLWAEVLRDRRELP